MMSDTERGVLVRLVPLDLTAFESAKHLLELVDESSDSFMSTSLNSPDQPIFRAMKEEGGLPLVGRSSRTLGVRIEGDFADIVVSEDGSVQPRTGGMSVAVDAALNLPKPRLPRSLGGEGRDSVFTTETGIMPGSIALRVDAHPHALVEPSVRCLFSDFESALTGTQPNWRKIDA